MKVEKEIERVLRKEGSKLATKNYEQERWAVEQITGVRERIEAELAKVIIGQKDVIEHLIIAVLSGGH